MKVSRVPPSNAKNGMKSPLTLITKSRSASRDLESYILRNSTESLRQKGAAQYNFKEVDKY